MTSPSEPTTVRDYVHLFEREIRSGDLTPGRASEMLVEATSLLSTVLTEIREADVCYAEELLHCLDVEEAASRAKIRAETSAQYLRKREARDTQTVLVELIRSLKLVLRVQTEEMRLTR